MADVIEKVAWTPVIARGIPFALSDDPDGLFYCIGGKIEKGETPIEALMREVFEEASVRLIPGTIRLVRYFVGPAAGKSPGTLLRMWCYEAQHEGKITPSGEVQNIALFCSGDKYRTTPVGRDVLGWFHSNHYIA